METQFPDGINNVSEPHFLVSFSEQEPFWFKGLLSVPSGYLFPSTVSLLIFTKMRGTAAFYSSSPLCHRVIGLRVAGSVFTVGQLHPAGCAVGVPSVVWELCLQDTTLPGENGLGGGIGRVGAAWLLSVYHMHLTSFKFCQNLKIMEALPAKNTVVSVVTPYLVTFPSSELYQLYISK